MTIRKYFVGVFMAVLAVSGGSSALAQPDPNAVPKAANPAFQQPLPAGGDWQKMTPEQRRQAVRQMVEQTLRGSLTRLGFLDKEMQDAVIACATEQEKALEPVRAKHRAVAQALIGNTPTDEQMTVLMSDLRATIQEARNKREAAIVALDEKIGFSQKPRLEALLSMVGVIGDETSSLGGVAGSIIGTMTNVAAGAEANDPAAAQPGNAQ